MNAQLLTNFSSFVLKPRSVNTFFDVKLSLLLRVQHQNIPFQMDVSPLLKGHKKVSKVKNSHLWNVWESQINSVTSDKAAKTDKTFKNQRSPEKLKVWSDPWNLLYPKKGDFVPS